MARKKTTVQIKNLLEPVTKNPLNVSFFYLYKHTSCKQGAYLSVVVCFKQLS